MEKNEFRVGKTAKETQEKFEKYYGTSAPLNATVKKWIQEFKLGRRSTNDEQRSGRTSNASRLKMVKKRHCAFRNSLE